MEAVAATAAPADEALAARAAAGDRQALAAFYELHFDGVFDFALRIVRRRALAAAVVRRAFAEERSSKVELYTAARELALEELRKHRRTDGRGTDRVGYDFTRIDAERLDDPSMVLFDRELVELVWECAAALSPEDYALLDLHVRQGVAGDDDTSAKLTRIRDSFEDTVTSTLLMMRARSTCERLELLLANAEWELEAGAVLMAVQHHARTCRTCQESKRRFVSPLDVFAALAPIPASRGFRAALWSELQPQSSRRWTERLRSIF